MKTHLRLLLFAFSLSAFPLFRLSAADSLPGRAGAGDQWIVMLPSAIALVTGIAAIWQKRKRSTAEKIRDTLILGIEHGSTIAMQTGKPDAVKWAIRARAVKTGVEAVLQPRVKELTRGGIDYDELKTRVDIEHRLRTRELAPDDSGADRP